MPIEIYSSNSIGVSIEFHNAQDAFNHLCKLHPSENPLSIQAKLIKLLLESPLTIIL